MSSGGYQSLQVSKGATGRLLKRCTAHVYIACLIHNLNKPEIKQNLSLQPNQVKPPNEGEKQGVFKAINDFERVDKGANGVILTNDIPYTTSERDSCEGRGGILQHKRLYQDQQQNTEASRANTLQKQVDVILQIGDDCLLPNLLITYMVSAEFRFLVFVSWKC